MKKGNTTAMENTILNVGDVKSRSSGRGYIDSKNVIHYTPLTIKDAGVYTCLYKKNKKVITLKGKSLLRYCCFVNLVKRIIFKSRFAVHILA